MGIRCPCSPPPPKAPIDERPLGGGPSPLHGAGRDVAPEAESLIVSLVQIGLFPLPGFVLFPRTAVPLHIFEPRYVRLVRDSLKANKRLALGQLRRGWEKDYYGA